MPGVSTRTTWAAERPGSVFVFLRSGTSRTPWMRVRVVCGLCVTIASFWPRRALSNVDLPALGRPMMETKPERNAIVSYYAPWAAFRSLRLHFSRMNRATRNVLLVLLLLSPLTALSQTASQAAQKPARPADQTDRPPAPVHSPEVHADRTITFRYRDALASQAAVVVDVNGAPLTMTKGPDGVWSATTPPMPPEIYTYHFTVDGITRADASNPHVVHSLSNLSSMVEVPGDGPQMWDARDVPHGV